MSNILYIKASPRSGRSHSIAVADAFLEDYVKQHPEDKVNTIDLFQRSLIPFDSAAATAKYKIMHSKKHTAEDKKIWSEVVSVIEEFTSADKYVLAVPMWNFSIPYRLKQYIDIIVQPTYTFTIDEKGNYHGLVKDKPVFIAYARGGEYTSQEGKKAFDLQKRYLELILAFIGLTDLRSVVVEPTLEGGEETARLKQDEAIEEAKKSARSF